MATTTNFGWETPDDTDLVKDGAAAIRTALGGVDTSFVDLKGGTTGQVLAKSSNTDLDFVWSAAAGIPATIFDAKGDLIAATAADTASRLAIGSNNQVLTADSSAATGMKWAAAPGGSYTWTSYTPTLTNVTIGNGTRTFVYAQIDKVIMVRGEIVLGSTSSVTGQIGISLPVTSAGSIYLPDFTVEMFNSGTGIAYPGAGSIYSSTINLTAFLASSTYLSKSATSSTVPFTFASGSTITITGFYQAA